MDRGEVSSIAGVSGIGGLPASIALRQQRAALDRHLADQIVLYLALAERAPSFTTEKVTDHLLTNLRVISLFCSIHYSVEGKVGEKGTVKISCAQP